MGPFSVFPSEDRTAAVARELAALCVLEVHSPKLGTPKRRRTSTFSGLATILPPPRSRLLFQHPSYTVSYPSLAKVSARPFHLVSQTHIPSSRSHWLDPLHLQCKSPPVQSAPRPFSAASSLSGKPGRARKKTQTANRTPELRPSSYDEHNLFTFTKYMLDCLAKSMQIRSILIRSPSRTRYFGTRRSSGIVLTATGREY